MILAVDVFPAGSTSRKQYIYLSDNSIYLSPYQTDTWPGRPGLVARALLGDGDGPER